MPDDRQLRLDVHPAHGHPHAHQHVIWVLLVPTFATAVGFAYACSSTVARREVLQGVLFMPIAISFVGAGVIWSFVYEYRSGDREQIGLLNAIVVAFGGEPVQWLQTDPINTFLLIVVMIWIQTGFAMVLLSAAIKGVRPSRSRRRSSTAERLAALPNVTMPGIRGSLVVVLTTISIATLKVFDIVHDDRRKLQHERHRERDVHPGVPGERDRTGSALALILFVLVLPIVIYNVNVLRKQREIR